MNEVLTVRVADQDEIDANEGLMMCDVCGEELIDGDEVVDMPFTLIAPGSGLRPVTPVHPACAVRNRYRVVWENQ